ncbi:hypothetical protein QUB19_12765 [Microcoleus sp. B4-C5]|uniref:hypothetical protein n=1 Tax=unclassified Microcoleus TaxID=2642155 RepID=UPI002FCEBE4B
MVQHLCLTDILHHCQQQAFRPVPQENLYIVEQAGKPVHKSLVENGVTSEFNQIRSTWEFRECESFGRLSMRAKI